MDRDNHDDGATSASESEHGDASDVSENGDAQGGDAGLSGDGRGAPDDDPEEEDDDDDSDAETQRIGTSVLRFARRCVKSGEFAKAMTALLNVVEISELDAVPCRQALLFAAQVFIATNQEQKALECMMELWAKMPPPYTRQDAQLLLAVIYERLDQPRAVAFWFKKAFGTSSDAAPSSAASTLGAWLSLAERSYDEGDFTLSTEAYTRAFGCIFQTQRWPADLSTFRFVARFLTALVSVARLRRDRQSYRQQIAFSLAVALLESNAIDSVPLVERAFDREYLALRRVYAASFPSIYRYLFADEDAFVGRISRAWRVWRARRERKRAIAAMERLKREAALAAKAQRAARAKKKKKKPKSPKRSDDEAEQEQLRLLRQRTKARIESLRVASPVRKKKASPPKPARVAPDTKPTETVTSPTRRKLETVKRLRSSSVVEASETQDEHVSESGNQRPTSSEASPSRAASLLDVYAFPPLGSHRRAFEADAGRAPGPADIEDDELQEIEAFARLAHYRSRVLVQRHTSIQDVVQLERVTPPWLRRFQDAVGMIETHEQLPRAPTNASHFTEIHARVVFQLTKVYTQYTLQHGKTSFTIQLARLLRRLETWQFTSVTQELVPALRAVQATGEREEAHRNLEFFHAQQQQRA